MKTIRAIPKADLCQSCNRGRLIKSTMPKKSIKRGQHWRAAQCYCDRCGESSAKYFEYVGVEE